MKLRDLKKGFLQMNMDEKRKLISDIREARLRVIIPTKKTKAKIKAKAKVKKKKEITEMSKEELLAEAARLKKFLEEKGKKS